MGHLLSAPEVSLGGDLKVRQEMPRELISVLGGIWVEPTPQRCKLTAEYYLFLIYLFIFLIEFIGVTLVNKII